jgi:hypothetical protein
MSDYTVVGAVDETLRTLLWSQFETDSEISSIITSEQQITNEPPFKLIKNTDPDEDTLSIFLYRVAENGELKNRQLQPINSNSLRYPPLCLNLYYLITPLTNSTENDHKLLGKTMQVIYDNSTLQGSALKGVLQNSAEELRLILNPLSLEDHSKLWTAFMRPLRLSLSYEVKIVFIDSQREVAGEPVLNKKVEFSQFKPASQP